MTGQPATRNDAHTVPRWTGRLDGWTPPVPDAAAAWLREPGLLTERLRACCAGETGLVVVAQAEAPLAALDDRVTSVPDFYVRTNLGVPDVDRGSWTLTVDGLVERPVTLSLADLAAMPSRTLSVTLECAGNNRTRLAPITEGEPWGPGAISTGVFYSAHIKSFTRAPNVYNDNSNSKSDCGNDFKIQ